MRRIQIYLEEKVDEALQSEAARTGRSKAALIRECVSSRYGARGTTIADPFDELIGAIDVPAAAVDDVVYGPHDHAREGVSAGSRRKASAGGGSRVRTR